jgi:hypothetical protein
VDRETAVVRAHKMVLLRMDQPTLEVVAVVVQVRQVLVVQA